jgi:hypothetical protein
MTRKLIAATVFVSLLRCGGESTTHLKEGPPIIGAGGAPTGSGGAPQAGSPGHEQAGSPGHEQAGSPGHEQAGSPGHEQAGASGREQTGSGGVSGQGTGGKNVVGGTAGKGGSAAAGAGTAGTTGHSGSGGDAGGPAICGADCSVPPGRPESVACPATDVSSEEPVAAGAGGADASSCSVDADCVMSDPRGLLVHCLKGQCGPDECLLDSDCPSGQACGCAGQFFGNAFHTNRCVPSNCRVDGDCAANGACSVITTGYCGSFNGFYCHTPYDQCHTDMDCTNPVVPICNYIPMLGHWACEAPTVCNG